MSTYYDNYDTSAKRIIEHVGKNINIGVPLGLGKPIGLLNALFSIAQADKSINLTIITGLTLARPTLHNKLEKRFVEPILERLLKDYEDPLYEKYRVANNLPDNINVIEFFLTPGKFLNNAYVQQNYISSSYTSVVRDVMNLSANILAQQVAPSKTKPGLFSLSCNTDLFHDMQQQLKSSEQNGNKIAIIAEVNSNLPYMYGDLAEVEENIFTDIIDTKKYRSLFVVPRDELSPQDHLIGLYTSSLIKDDSCLQIGIGKLSNALASALILRQKNNNLYLNLLQELKLHEKFDNIVTKCGALSTFSKGVYASTEMLSDEYMQLYNEGILKKRVYDHIGLQKLLNTNKIDETIHSNIIDILLDNKIININLSNADLCFMQKFGILKSDISFRDDNLILSNGEVISANLALSKHDIVSKCLGSKLKSGKIIHAGFFFGTNDLYTQLSNLSYDEAQQIEMTSIARTNALLWSPELLILQRQRGRFVNSSIMVTLLGGIISDGIKNYQEVSGVGGQYDFISMANQLKDAHSIINCRSTRVAKNGLESNIVWDYTNSTISRYLRDVIVTEYGIADCRSKTDSDVIKAILNITDSRFQLDLLNKAKKGGKIPHDYQIPEIFTNNFPDTIIKIIKKAQAVGYCMPYPFGSDLTKDEEILANTLLYLKNCSKKKLLILIMASLFYFPSDKKFAIYLDRLSLTKTNNIKDYIYKKLLKFILRRNIVEDKT